MNFKKKLSLLIIFLIIIFQVFLYTNNNQRTSFKYFKWTLKEISIGKLISISFFSGLFVSTIMNISTKSHKKSTVEDVEENYESLNNESEMNSNVEIPPQRDIRDAQPTISVNYRVVKNMEENNLNREQNTTNNSYNNDDWEYEDNDW